MVATPIGNPGDLSPRAADTLQSVDLVLAEDTRRAGLFLKRHGLTAKRLASCFEHNEIQRLPEVLGLLASGGSAAVMTDAGSPLVSDPGFRLVRACREAGFAVKPVPGPSAALAALMCSGLPPQPFAFLGFPPRKPGERKNFFAPWKSLSATLVFFESKLRLAPTLEACVAVLLASGYGRGLVLARELTKTHEQFITGRLEKWRELNLDLLGEVTVVIGPPEQVDALEPADGPDSGSESLEELVRREAAQGGKPKAIVRRVLEARPEADAKAVARLVYDLPKPNVESREGESSETPSRQVRPAQSQ